MLRRNIFIDSGWINGTLIVVTALTDNCIVVCKLTNTAHSSDKNLKSMEHHTPSYVSSSPTSHKSSGHSLFPPLKTVAEKLTFLSCTGLSDGSLAISDRDMKTIVSDV